MGELYDDVHAADQVMGKEVATQDGNGVPMPNRPPDEIERGHREHPDGTTEDYQKASWY